MKLMAVLEILDHEETTSQQKGQNQKQHRALTHAIALAGSPQSSPFADRELIAGSCSTNRVFYLEDNADGLRVSRNIALGERVTLRPFAEFFNLFNRADSERLSARCLR